MKNMLVLPAVFASTYANAHPGHDHSHWLSEPLHALTALSIGLVITAGVVLARKYATRTSKGK